MASIPSDVAARLRPVRRGRSAATEPCRICGYAEPRSLGQVRGYRFVECPACAFVFAPALRARQQARYAAGWHGARDGAPDVGWADASFLEPALALVRPGGPLRVLDFGAGQSHVPELLRAAGHRVVAVDVVPPLRPHPDRLTGDLLELSLPAQGFDLVYSFQVLEHLPEPRPYLERLLRLTGSGGVLYLHTDMDTPERQQGFASW